MQVADHSGEIWVTAFNEAGGFGCVLRGGVGVMRQGCEMGEERGLPQW